MNKTINDQVKPVAYGKLAFQYCNLKLELEVLSSAAGYYIGTFNEEGPVSRESTEYWGSSKDANTALKTNNWMQKEQP